MEGKNKPTIPFRQRVSQQSTKNLAFLQLLIAEAPFFLPELKWKAHFTNYNQKLFVFSVKE